MSDIKVAEFSELGLSCSPSCNAAHPNSENSATYRIRRIRRHSEHSMAWLCSVLALATFTASPLLSDEPVEKTTLEFNRDIRPILSENCFQCHGPDENARKGELRLDVRQDAVDAGAIVPDKPAESTLWERVSSDDPDLRMPPPSAKKNLTEEQRSTLRRWLESGATYQSHWAFAAPQIPIVPRSNAPTTWVHNEIDAFIYAGLEQMSLLPAEQASRQRLIRRVTFDLTGLPPSLNDVDAFLSDKDDGAFERVVDRLLASDRFGERMASDWLDSSRYSDTYGYQVDRDRRVWPWRDWVIGAFNRNLPYNAFLTEQLAGDLLPNASDEQILATTFNRLHPQKVEGGSTPEEFRIEYVSDRMQTFSTAMLGLTFECARCHDHKYDPLTQREYYQLTAFFDKIDESGLYSYFTNSVPTPTLRLPNAAQKVEGETLAAEVTAIEAEATDLEDEFNAWFETRGAKGASGDPPLIPGQIAHLDFEDVAGPNESIEGKFGKAARLTGDDAIGVGQGNFHRSEPFSISLWINSPDEKERAVLFHRSRAWTDAASRGYQLLMEEGHLSFSLIHFWPGNAIRVRTPEKVAIGRWVHVAIAYDGSSTANGVRMWLDGEPIKVEIVRDNLYRQIRGGGGDNIAIGERFRDRGFSGGGVDEFRVFSRELSTVEVRQLHDNLALPNLLGKPETRLTPEQLSLLREYHDLAISETARLRRERLQPARQKYADYQDRLEEIMVMREATFPRKTYLLKRGAYDALGDEVQPTTPSALTPYPVDAPPNRLGLAQWLTDKRHPLTGRVAVNRYWQLLMGEGLVRSPEDFGSQGKPPTHPQLLDWLATDFSDNGWDVKRLLKNIVMSATYQQDSKGTAESVQRDPDNLFWSRALRYRLPAEMLRDNALAVSGLIVERVGGPPTKPYEVEASFKPVGKDTGDGLYRRSVYTYWKRTAPAPVMMALDASKRDVCRVKRERTNSPLQLLVLLNGPQFTEANQALATRTMAAAESLDPRLRYVFRTLTSRQPLEAELIVIRELWEKERLHLSTQHDQVRALLALPSEKEIDEQALDLATMTIVVSVLMSFDESIVRR
jgi:hypothetical protein